MDGLADHLAATFRRLAWMVLVAAFLAWTGYVAGVASYVVAMIEPEIGQKPLVPPPVVWALAAFLWSGPATALAALALLLRRPA